jgi:biopolymer transport protein ExbB
MVEFFEKGGIFMWPLLFCGIVGIGFIIERFISYTLARINLQKFMLELKQIITEKGINEGINYCKTHRSPVARILEAGLTTYKKVGPYRDPVEEAISNAGSIELAFLDRGLPVLAAVTTIAPIIGFLGTVAGMINAFDAVALAGELKPTLVASGISEALITTATGLTIAAPMAAFHVYFTSRSNGYSRNMETVATELITFLMEEKP